MIRTKRINPKKIMKAIKVAYGVDNYDAESILPMYKNMRIAA